MTGSRSVWVSRGTRLLVVAPGLFAPLVLLVECIRTFVHQAALYFSLPVPADPNTYSLDAGGSVLAMWFAGFGAVFALLLFVPPLWVAVPRRLRLWMAIVAVLMQMYLLCVAFLVGSTASGWNELALLSMAYVPALVIARFVRQLRQPALSAPVAASCGSWPGRGRRVLFIVPGLIAPVAAFVVCVQSLVHETAIYYAIPLSERTGDTGPLGYTGGMEMARVSIVLSLFLLLPPLLVCVPRRLRTWEFLAALAVQLYPLLVALGSAIEGHVGGAAWFVLYAYVLVLGVVRLVLQARAERAPDFASASGGPAGGCSVSKEVA